MEEAVAPIILFLKGIVIGLAVSVPMGPIGVLCVQKTINKGRLHGMLSGFGAAFADTVFAIIVLFGLGTKIFFSNPITQIRRRARNKRQGIFGDFISVFFLTLSNPLTVLRSEERR